MDSKSKNCLYCRKPFVGSRSTRKYCSDRCKQAAFYSRAAQPSGLGNGIISSMEEQQTYGECEHATATKPLVVATEKTERLYPVPFDDEQANADLPFNVKKSRNQPGECSRSESNQKHGTPPSGAHNPMAVAGEPYRWVRSGLIDDIGGYINADCIVSDMFQYPNKYWYSSDFEKVKWISVRFRCIIENLLRLDRTIVERKTLITLREAINAMVASRNFKSIPANYPMKNEVAEWQKNIGKAAKNADGEVRFKLKTENKVKLICLRFQLADIVPFTKFSNLDFTK